MTSRSSRFPTPRLATALALLALLAQLWFAQVSTGHQARLVTGGAAALDICSAADASGADGGEHAPGTGQPVNCQVCFAAGTATAPAAGAPASQDALAPARPRQFQHCVEPRARRRAGLRPPAQAPPAA